jgi:hypothetical protein
MFRKYIQQIVERKNDSDKRKLIVLKWEGKILFYENKQITPSRKQHRLNIVF